MAFTIALYSSLTIFLLGSLYRIWSWFRIRIGPEASAFSTGQRLAAAAKGFAATLFSRRVFSLLKVLVLDVILQARILKDDFLRWFMHICIFAGFISLLVMHALNKPLTLALFPNYAPTLNPFLFLRNLFGAMLLLGIAIALYRRIRHKEPHLFTNAADRCAIVILATVLVSGIALEGAKIISPAIFDSMVEEYSTLTDSEEIDQLKHYWAKDFGVVFPDRTDVTDHELIQKGRELHNQDCASCHSSPRNAFLSYPLSKLMARIAPTLEMTRASVWLWYIHFLSCFVGLAYLPFSKMFHIVSSPISLFADKGTDHTSSGLANRVTRRALSLDACTHCGACSLHCSVKPVLRNIPNTNVLPSEKLISLRTMAKGKKTSAPAMHALAEGSLICTGCYRCTTVCPVGIDLQDLWTSSKSDLADKGFPEPHIWIRKANTAEWAARFQGQNHDVYQYQDERLRGTDLNLSDRIEAFQACVQCQTCTNVCPVVACSENPAEDLGLTPQQIMNLLRLGLKKMTLGSRMVWDCVTCYMCQEHCPEGIRVADVLYELRNLAYVTFGAVHYIEKEKNGAHTYRAEDTDESEGSST